MSKRIQYNRRARLKGITLPPGAIYVGRPSRWGNPYKVGEYTRAEALRLYRIYLDEKLKDGTIDLSPLIGKDLACSCSLSEPCHGDILLEKLSKHNKP